jgi:hypothetical protein
VPVLKPIRGLRLNKSHPLARGLVSCWLMNEGSGNKVFNLSGSGHDGTFTGTALSWNSGKFGPAVNLPGSDEYVNVGPGFPSLVNAGTISVWFNTTVLAPNPEGVIVGATKSASERIEIAVGNLSTFSVIYFNGSDFFGASESSSLGWHHIALVMNNGAITGYLNGILMDGTLDTKGMSSDDNFAIGAAIGTTPDYFNGKVDNVMVWTRTLSASEIALLYREPFCMFARAGRSELIGGQIFNLAGTSAALSSLSATAKAMRKISGNVASISDVEALLNSIRSRLETERNWLREALFNGMTANAFKLGTTLSLGWFWVRIAGCSILYRGSSMEEIDFVNVLAVAESEACEISGPSYIPHNSGSTYFYVIRRFNNCGYQEHTLAAAVKVSIDSNGNLAEPQPNKVFSSKVEQVSGNKIQLVWFYCSLAQKSQPVCFNVYYDNRTGQINYQNPLATISYKGRKFYSFQSSTLEAGKYLFAIKAEDAGGIENSSLARLRIQLDNTNPDAVDILRAEAV